MLAYLVRFAAIVSDRTFHLKSYKKCFTATEFVDWLIENGYTGSTVDEAAQRDIGVEIGIALQNGGYIDHVSREHKFKDKPLFFRWCCDDAAVAGVERQASRDKDADKAPSDAGDAAPAPLAAAAEGPNDFCAFQEIGTERDATVVKRKVFGWWPASPRPACSSPHASPPGASLPACLVPSRCCPGAGTACPTPLPPSEGSRSSPPPAPPPVAPAASVASNRGQGLS